MLILDQTYYAGNRQKIYEGMEDDSLLVLFSGQAPRQSSDQKYGFFCNRNFLYMTGCEEEGIMFLAEKRAGNVTETIYLRRPNYLIERSSGKRLKADECTAISGVTRIASSMSSGASSVWHYARGFHQLYLDLTKLTAAAQREHRFAIYAG